MKWYSWIIWKNKEWYYECLPIIKDAFEILNNSWLFERLIKNERFVFSLLIRMQQFINDWDSHRAITIADDLTTAFNLFNEK